MEITVETIETLNRQLENLQLLVDHSLDVIYRIGLDRKLNYVSPSVVKLTGRTQEDWIENSLTYINSIPANREAIENAIKLAQSGQPIPPYRIIVNHPNGQRLWVEVNEQPYWEHGEIRGFIGVARDITERVLLEEKFQKQRLMLEKELELASQVHETLIPQNLTTDYMNLALTYRPVSRMGGDYANYIVQRDRLLFIISDVTGHGVPAALLVNRLDSEFQRLASRSVEPGKLLQKLELFIKNQFRGTQMYLSAFCGLLDFKTRRLTYSNYGHLPQIVFQPSSQILDLLPAQTTLLGIPVSRDKKVFQETTELDAHSRLFLFTDGVTETQGPGSELFGYGRLKEFIADNGTCPPQEFNEKLLDALTRFKGGDFLDDIFMFHLEMKQ